jgi:hypothetical protein
MYSVTAKANAFVVTSFIVTLNIIGGFGNRLVPPILRAPDIAFPLNLAPPPPGFDPQTVKHEVSPDQWCTERVVWGFKPSPKFRRFNKAEPNSQFRGKYIRTCLVFLFHQPN